MRTGPLGPTVRRLRGATLYPLPIAAALAGLTPDDLEAIETGRVVPSPAALRSIADAWGLDLVARAELERERRRTVSLVRANPWARANRQRRAS